MQWLTTCPNPRARQTGFDAGQSGWKLHALAVEPTAKFGEIANKRAACGLLPMHGWSLDLYIEDKCQNCLRALEKSSAR